MLTLGNAQTSRLARVGGFVPTSADWILLINDAMRECMRRVPQYRRMCSCVYGGCITWPRSVNAVLAINRPRHHVPVRNHWYEYHTIFDSDRQHCRGGCTGSGTHHHGGHSDHVALSGNHSSVFNPIAKGVSVYLRFYCDNQADIGKTVRIFGVDSNGQRLVGMRPDGTFQEGLVLTFAAPYVQSTVQVRHIEYALKDETQGAVRGYQWDGTQLWDLAYYEPSETAPDYATSTIQGMACSSCSTSPQFISALVTLKAVPARFADDLILIDNVDALAAMMQAIKYGEAGDSDNQLKQETIAVHSLNLDIWGTEEAAISFHNNVFSGARIGRQQCF